MGLLGAFVIAPGASLARLISGFGPCFSPLSSDLLGRLDTPSWLAKSSYSLESFDGLGKCTTDMNTREQCTAGDSVHGLAWIFTLPLHALFPPEFTEAAVSSRFVTYRFYRLTISMNGRPIQNPVHLHSSRRVSNTTKTTAKPMRPGCMHHSQEHFRFDQAATCP